MLLGQVGSISLYCLVPIVYSEFDHLNLVLRPSLSSSRNLYPRCGPNKITRQQSLQKLSQIQQSIVNWEGKDIASNSSEVVYGKTLQSYTSSVGILVV